MAGSLDITLKALIPPALAVRSDRLILCRQLPASWNDALAKLLAGPWTLEAGDLALSPDQVTLTVASRTTPMPVLYTCPAPILALCSSSEGKMLAAFTLAQSLSAGQGVTISSFTLAVGDPS
jgi:hypothetical protein